MTSSTIRKLDARLYPGHEKRWDDKLFREYVLRVLRADDKLLDLGAGSGRVSEMNFRGIVSCACGVDPDARVMDNPYLDDAKIGVGEKIDYPTSFFDVVISDNVLEHLDTPGLTFLEINRVLKPGGLFLFKTPNKYHYMPLVAALTPTWFHKLFNRARGRREDDTFPTRYRANSTKQVTRLARSSGFEIIELQKFEGRPEYLRFSSISYLLGYAYERFVNSAPLLSGLRILLIGQLQKPYES